MSELHTIDLEVFPIYSQVQFFGDGDDYPDWGDASVAVSGATATYVAVVESDTYQVTLHIFDAYRDVAECFYESAITIGGDGLEVAEVINSSAPGVEGIVGLWFALPWVGAGCLKFVARGGFVDDLDGGKCPRALDVFVMPAQTDNLTGSR